MTTREQVWLAAWAACASAANTLYKDVPTSWADMCLTDFDSRFPQEKKPISATVSIPEKHAT